MTTREFIHEYALGIMVRGRQGSLSVRDDKLFSYDTVIAHRIEGVIHINMTSYSTTSSKHRNDLIRFVRDQNIRHSECLESIPVNTESMEAYCI